MTALVAGSARAVRVEQAATRTSPLTVQGPEAHDPLKMARAVWFRHVTRAHHGMG